MIAHDSKEYMVLNKQCGDPQPNPLPVFISSSRPDDQLILVIGHATGDGSCFFHSIGQLLFPDSYDKQGVVQFRKQLADEFTIDDLYTLDDGLIVWNEVSDYIPFYANAQELQQDVNNLPDELQPAVQASINELYQEKKAYIADPSEWAEDWTIRYISEKFHVNILVYSNDNKKFTVTTVIHPDWPVAFIYNMTEQHYQPMFGLKHKTLFKYKTVKKYLQGQVLGTELP